MKRLPESYLIKAERRARRFAGAYTGTAGSLAADVLRLLKEREKLMSEITMEEANKELREAVKNRLENGGAAQASTDVSFSQNEKTDNDDFILKAQEQLRKHRTPGDGIVNAPADELRPGSAEVLKVFEEAAQLHLRKTLDYGADENALRNIQEGADLINVESWRACLIRIADKMSRMRAFCRRGRVEFDGVEDNLIDIVSYAAICLAEFRREQKTG